MRTIGFSCWLTVRLMAKSRLPRKAPPVPPPGPPRPPGLTSHPTAMACLPAPGYWRRHRPPRLPEGRTAPDRRRSGRCGRTAAPQSPGSAEDDSLAAIDRKKRGGIVHGIYGAYSSRMSPPRGFSSDPGGGQSLQAPAVWWYTVGHRFSPWNRVNSLPKSNLTDSENRCRLLRQEIRTALASGTLPPLWFAVGRVRE